MLHATIVTTRVSAWLRGALLLTPLLAGPAAGIEQPRYALLLEDGDFSLRQYAPYLVAETRVSGAFEDAGDLGFNRLFRYITGANQPAAEISMTAPVTQGSAGTDIAMTAPVAQAAAPGGYAVSFMLPSSYTRETAPQPTDPDVYIRAVPAETLAVVRFSGFWSDANYRRQEARLRQFVDERGLQVAGEPRLARYDPPFTPPFLRRNEILIPVTGPVPTPKP